MNEKDAPFITIDSTELYNYLLMLARLHVVPRLRSQFDPADVVQQVLLKVHSKRGQFHGETRSEWIAWLRRILDNHVIDLLRSRGAAPIVALDSVLNPSSVQFLSYLGESQSTPSQVAVQHEQELLLSRALARLPDDQRAAVELKHLHGWSVTAISEHLERSQESVGGLLRRGMKTLRELLTETADQG